MKWYQIISLALLVMMLLPLSPVVPSVQFGSEGDKTLVSITFDDGYKSWITEANPILLKYDLPATAFVNDPDYFGSASFNPENEYTGDTEFSRQDIQNLYYSGWEIGWHTAKHPALTKLTNIEIIEAVENWRQMFSDLSLPQPPAFAYPGGDYDENTADIVLKRFLAARTADMGINTPESVQNDPAKLKCVDTERYVVDWYSGDGVFLVFLLHTVGQVAGWQSQTDIDTKEFEDFCQYLSHQKDIGAIDVVSFSEGVAIMNERNPSSSWTLGIKPAFGFSDVAGVPIPDRYFIIPYLLAINSPRSQDIYTNTAFKIASLLIILGAAGFITASLVITVKNRLQKTKVK